MRRVAAVVLVAAPLFVLGARPLSGQLHLEVRGGAGVGAHSETQANLDLVPRPTYEALVLWALRPRVSLYGGFVRTSFGCEEGFCLGRDLTVAGHHGVVGVEVSRGMLWARMGGLYGVTRVGSEGEAPGPAPGVEVRLGASLGSGRLRFLPGVSLRRLGAADQGGHATALTADIGVRFALGAR